MFGLTTLGHVMLCLFSPCWSTKPRDVASVAYVTGQAYTGLSTVMENLEKSWNFYNGHFQAWKSHGKNLNHQSLGKVMEIFIYAKFEIINMFFKERHSKCKPAIRNIF